MSEVATKNITFWNTTGYNYPGFGKSTEVPDALGGTISITYNQIDYNDRSWKAKPDGNVPVAEDRFLSGEIENNFSLTGQVKGITATMPLIRALGSENNYSVTLDFSKYKASAGGSKATDGATSGDTYLAISRFFNGSKAGYTTIKVTARTLDGSQLNLGDWKLFNSGTLGKGNNARIFLNAATQTISGKNSQGKQELCPTPPNPGSSFGTDTGLGLFELPSNQRYVSITLSFKQKKITGVSPNDLHDIYVSSNTSSTSPIDETPPPPMDINRGLQLHLPLNEIVENAESEKEVVDTSGAQLNGKVNGATVVPDSKFGNCINFDGVDDYIQMPEMNLDYSQGLTVAVWVHYNSFKHWSRIIDFGNGPGNNNIVFANELTTNDLALVVLKSSNPGNRIKADGRLELNQWLYLTVTIDGSGSGKIYKNGEEVQSGLVHLPNTVNRAKNYIGKSNWSVDKYFHGQMSNLRLYNRGLSKAEINECMKGDETPPPIDNINLGLQLHLPLNEIVENAAKEKEVVDISGAQLNGKVNGATVIADSKFGNCINFDGVDDYIELPTATIPQTGEITISFWANGDNSLPKDNSIIAAYDQSNNRVINIHLPWNDSKIDFDCGNTGNSYDRIEKLAEAVDFKDQWNHWVFTKNVTTGEMNIYLNGTLWDSGKDKNKQISGTTLVKFGSGYGFYHGQVAHLRIYDRVLSPEEINECMKVDGTETTSTIGEGNTDSTSTAGEDYATPTTDGTETTSITGEGNTDSTSTAGEDDATPTTDGTETTSITGEGNTDSTSTAGEDDATPTTDGTDPTSTTGEGNTDSTSTAGEDNATSTTDGTETTSTTGEGNTDSTSTAGEDNATSTTDGTETTSTATDTTDTTQKPMEYQIYQVKGNPTIKTGYPASEWTAVIAGFNCGAKQKHKATALTIMPVVDDGEWKIKCDIKDADDRYWDVAVLFIRNNMVNRLSHFNR